MIANICPQCNNTGIITPIDEISLETLHTFKNQECVMECDYCDTAPDFDLYEKYIDNAICGEFKENL